MKQLFLVVLVVVAVASANFSVFAMAGAPKQNVSAQQDVATVGKDGQVIAYYFHGTFRCYTCTNMEQFSKEAIEANFKDALVSGSLAFKAVNVEDQGNEHFVNDYRLYTKSLVLSFMKGGKEIRYKNLDKIWQFAGNKQKFIDYVVDEVNEFMKDVQ